MIKQIFHTFRAALSGCLLTALCSTGVIAEEDIRMGGRASDILAGSRMIVINDNYYYVDRKAPIHADWSRNPMTLETLQPGMNIGIRISPSSADDSIPHIKEIWVYAD